MFAMYLHVVSLAALAPTATDEPLTSNIDGVIASIMQSGRNGTQRVGDMAGEGRENDEQLLVDLYSRFKICGQCDKYMRVGNQKGDGGYATCMDPPAAARPTQLYSFGIRGTDMWGETVSKMFDAPVNQYDCFDTTVPTCSAGSTCRFFPICLKSTKIPADKQARTFGQIFNDTKATGPVYVKMDIEASEWDAFEAATEQDWSKISQLVMEFHFGTNNPFLHDRIQRRIAALDRMLAHLTVVHTHGNNCCGTLEFNGYTVPYLLEVTYVRRDWVPTSPTCVSARPRPDLDSPCVPQKPEIAPPRLPAFLGKAHKLH